MTGCKWINREEIEAWAEVAAEGNRALDAYLRSIDPTLPEHYGMPVDGARHVVERLRNGMVSTEDAGDGRALGPSDPSPVPGLGHSASIPVAEFVAEKLVTSALEVYPSRPEIAAMRCALGDAASLCDAIARDIAAEHRGRGGKGAVTKLGLRLEAIAKLCGDAIWDMRDHMRFAEKSDA